MNGRNEENLKKLLEKLLNSEDAEQFERDVLEGEQILREYSAPEPDKQLIANIKADIARAILRKKTRRTYYEAAVAAAAVILLAIVGVKLFKQNATKPERFVAASIIPAAVWESEGLAADDENIAALTAEIEEVESEILAVKSGENGGNGLTDLEKLEMELVEINSSFWEG